MTQPLAFITNLYLVILSFSTIIGEHSKILNNIMEANKNKCSFASMYREVIISRFIYICIYSLPKVLTKSLFSSK